MVDRKNFYQGYITQDKNLTNNAIQKWHWKL